MKYFPKPYSLDTAKYIDQFREDLATFYTMKHDPNSSVEELDIAYDEFCTKIANRLQDLSLNAWLDGVPQKMTLQELQICSLADASTIVDTAMNQMEAINAHL